MQHQVQLALTELMDGLGLHFANLRRSDDQSNMYQSNLTKSGLIPGAASVRGTRPADTASNLSKGGLILGATSAHSKRTADDHMGNHAESIKRQSLEHSDNATATLIAGTITLSYSST